jgi:hypothetical protein
VLAKPKSKLSLVSSLLVVLLKPLHPGLTHLLSHGFLLLLHLGLHLGIGHV